MTLPVRRLLFSCMTLWCTLGSCERPDPENAQPPTAAEARELFDAVKIGMHRTVVERFLGAPVAERPGATSHVLRPEVSAPRAYYLQVPLPLAASPYQPGTIGIVYVDDRVVEKNFDPMVRD